MAAEDPFLQVQGDVLSLLDQSRPLFQSYLRIRTSATSSASPELAEAKLEVEKILKDLAADLQDLVEAVNAAEADPYSFGLDIEQVRRRRLLVDQIGHETAQMTHELQKATKEANLPGVLPTALSGPVGFHVPDDYAAEFEQQRQQQLLMEQDQVMNDVLLTVGNLRQQGVVMRNELEEQDQLLQEVHVVADRVDGKLQSGIKKMGWVIKQNEDTWSSFCIGLLICVLILLLVILLVA